MPISKKVRVPHRKGVIGDMRHPIVIIDPRIQAPQLADDFDYKVNKDQQIVVWGSIDTKAGQAVFDGAETTETYTDIITIRYSHTRKITKEFNLRVYSEVYDIIDVEDYENRHEFLKLKCRLIGREANVTGKPSIIPEQF
jgi:SPP1 family predicted phage head-tail adaptor